MAVVAEPEFVDGFDAYSLAQFGRKWTSAGTAPATLSTPGRAGIAGSQAMGGFNFMTRAVTPANVGVFNLAFKTPSSFGADNVICSFRRAGQVLDNLTLLYNSSGVLRLSNTDLATVGAATNPLQSLQASTWYFIEFASLMHVSAGTADVKVNGASITGLFGLTGIKTSDSFNLYDTITVTALGTGCLMDDLYFRRGSTSYNNVTDFLGDIVIETVYPDAISGDAGHTQGTLYGTATNRFDGIDEPNTANDETDGVDLATNGQKLYTSFGSLVGPAGSVIGTIHGVQLNILARKTDPGFAHAITPGCVKVTAYGTDYLGTSQALSDTFTDKRKAWATRPDGGGAFVTTDIATGWEWGCQRDS